MGGRCVSWRWEHGMSWAVRSSGEGVSWAVSRKAGQSPFSGRHPLRTSQQNRRPGASVALS